VDIEKKLRNPAKQRYLSGASLPRYSNFGGFRVRNLDKHPHLGIITIPQMNQNPTDDTDIFRWFLFTDTSRIK
jgi:hypothetical protein